MPKTVFCPHCEEEREYTVSPKNETLTVKGENIAFTAEVAVCHSCGKEVFSSDLDAVALGRAYDEYRKRHGLLLPSEVKKIRESYGLSQRAFSRLLNWGEVTIHRYETGSIQDQSHNDMLVLLRDPNNMKTLLERERNKLTPQEITRLEARLKLLSASSSLHDKVQDLLFEKPSVYNGFRTFDFARFANAVLFFASREPGLLKTKLLKLLWYSDFLSFRRNTISLTGSRYMHFAYGPVPEKYDLLLGTMDGELADIIPQPIPPNYMGEEIRARQAFDAFVFTADELAILADVADRFSGYTCSAISEYSHNEPAYANTGDRERISYEWATRLSVE